MADVTDQYDPIFEAAGREWNVDPKVLKALAIHEGGLNPNARGKSGEFGMTQIMPGTATHLGVTDLRDPVQQIYGAAKYLNEALTAEHDDPVAALRYYNGGPGWRSVRTDPNYPSYIGGQYQKLAKASTGTMTDASPAPAPRPAQDEAPPGKDPAKMTDAEWLDHMGQTYPSMKRPEWDSAPAPQPKDSATVAKDDDPFTRALNAPAESKAAAPAAPAESKAPEGPDPFTRALQAGDPTSEAAGVTLPDWARGKTTPPPPGADTTPGPGIPSVIAAGKNAFASSGHLLSPMATDWLGKQGFLGQVGLFGARLADTGWADVNALYAGGQEAGKQALSTVLPESLAETIVHAPDALAGSPHMLMTPGMVAKQQMGPGPAAPRPAPVDPLAARVAEVTQPRPAPSPVEGVPPVSPELAAKPAAGPTSAVPPEGAPQPQSAGAAASPAGAVPEKTPAQRLRDVQSDLTQTAEDRTQPGAKPGTAVDDTQYVQGIPPRMLPSREFSSENSVGHKDAYRNDQAYRAAYDANTKARNEGMVDLLRKDAGDDISLEQAHTAREQVSPNAMGVFSDETAVDAQPLVDRIDRALASGVQKRSGVATILKDVRDSLLDADGNPETAPSQLYAARQNITDYLKKGVRGTGDVADNVRAAKSILQDMLPEFDATIVRGAPKYSDYMKQFAEASKPIDQMEFLQRYQTGPRKLTDKDGYLQPQRVQKMLDDIYQGLRAKGVNPAKSLTDEQIQNVVNVRNELAAESLQDRLGAVKGSDTSQMLNQAGKWGSGPVGQAIKTAGSVAAHTALALKTGLVGNVMLRSYQEGRAVHQAQREANALAARKAQLLSQNPLSPP